MSLVQRYVNFFIDFERTVSDDEWRRLEGYFAKDAVYRASGFVQAELQGVKAILAGIKKSLNGFDRTFDGRTHEVDAPPAEEGNTVSVSGKIIYSKAGLPPLVLRATERVTYDSDGCISVLINEFPEDQSEVVAWRQQHGQGLDPSYV